MKTKIHKQLQQFFCNHNYKDSIRINGIFTFGRILKCIKCNKYKINKL
jgi:hypothetical protein